METVHEILQKYEAVYTQMKLSHKNRWTLWWQARQAILMEAPDNVSAAELWELSKAASQNPFPKLPSPRKIIRKIRQRFLDINHPS